MYRIILNARRGFKIQKKGWFFWADWNRYHGFDTGYRENAIEWFNTETEAKECLEAIKENEIKESKLDNTPDEIVYEEE